MQRPQSRTKLDLFSGSQWVWEEENRKMHSSKGTEEESVQISDGQVKGFGLIWRVLRNH